jgi:hypothetical protein
MKYKDVPLSNKVKDQSIVRPRDTQAATIAKKDE